MSDIIMIVLSVIKEHLSQVQAVLYLSNKHYFYRGISNLERANESHCEYRASREVGHGAHWGREAVELDPDRIDGEVIAGGRGAFCSSTST